MTSAQMNKFNKTCLKDFYNRENNTSLSYKIETKNRFDFDSKTTKSENFEKNFVKYKKSGE